MAETIKDGKGTGYVAGVNSDNRLLIEGVTTSKEHYVNINFEDSYNMLFEVTPSAGGSFLYLQNLSEDKIVCEGFHVYAAANEIITLYLGGRGTPVDGTTVVPCNLTSGAGGLANGLFQIGTNITGINNLTECARYRIPANDETNYRNFNADIVIPRGQTLIMKATNGGVLLDGFLVFWYENVI